MSEPWEGVSAKVSLVDEVLWRAVKNSTPLLKFPHTVGGFFSVVLGHLPVRQPLAAFHRVVEVNFPAVPWVGVLERGCAAPLGHHGMGFAEQRFGDDGGFCAGTGGLDGGSKTGSTGTDDDHVVFVIGPCLTHVLTSNAQEHNIADAPLGNQQHPYVP